MFALALVLSVVGLLVGPVLAMWARGRVLAVAALDGATLGVVPALILLRLLPHLVEEVGAIAVLGLVGGYLALQVVEARSHRSASTLGLALVMPSLAIHSFLDGTALALAFQRVPLGVDGATLGAALIVHKVPEGLFLATRVAPDRGARASFARIGALAAATVLGGLTGRELLAHTSDNALHAVVAVGLGVMLRMIVHRHDTAVAGKGERAAGGIAFLACLAAVLAIPSPHHLFAQAQRGELSAAQALVPLFLESAPWLLGVLVFSEIASAWSKPSPAGYTDHPSAWLATTVLTWSLLGPLVAAARAFADVMLGGAVYAASPHPAMRVSLAARIPRMMPRAGEVLPSYAVGVALAVAAEAAVPHDALAALGWLAVPMGAVAPLWIPIGPAGAVLLAVIIVHKGAPLAAGLAFMLAGSLAVSNGGRAWIRRGALLAGSAVVAVLLGGALAGFGARQLHGIGVHAHAPFEWIAATVLLAWTAIELVRAGPRGWFQTALGRPLPVE